MKQFETNRFPDFFLVGAPRCGTTALSRYLTRNPKICFSRPKDPHYFTKTDYIPAPPERLSPQMADVLRETLRPDVSHLSRLLDRDLSHWIDG